MRIQYTEKNQLPENIRPLSIEDAPCISLKEGYQVDGYAKETVSTCKRIALALLCVLIVPLFIKDLRRQIFQGKEIVYYCSVLPKQIEKIDGLANEHINPNPIIPSLQINHLQPQQINSHPINNPTSFIPEPKHQEPLINLEVKDVDNTLQVEDLMREMNVEKNLKAEELIRKKELEAAFKAKSKEEIREQSLNNSFNYAMESFSPFTKGDSEEKHLECLLNELPKDKAAFFLLGLLENPAIQDEEKKAKFVVFCLRLIYENFSDNNELMSDKKFELYATVLFELYQKDQLEKFWSNWSLDYKDGVRNGVPGPVQSSFGEFFDASILLGFKKNKMDLVKTVLKEGVLFGTQKIPTIANPNPVLAEKLNEEQKIALIDVAKSVHLVYNNATFNV